MRLTARPALQKQWPAIVKQCFRDDVWLLRKYHVSAPCALAEAVADTYLALRDCTGPSFVLYGLYAAGVNAPCGMVGVEAESNFLVTFGLALAYRNPAGLAALGEKIANLCDAGRPVQSIVYAKNQPARRFLQRMGLVPAAGLIWHPQTQQPGILYTL